MPSARFQPSSWKVPATSTFLETVEWITVLSGLNTGEASEARRTPPSAGKKSLAERIRRVWAPGTCQISWKGELSWKEKKRISKLCSPAASGVVPGHLLGVLGTLDMPSSCP